MIFQKKNIEKSRNFEEYFKSPISSHPFPGADLQNLIMRIIKIKIKNQQ